MAESKSGVGLEGIKWSRPDIRMLGQELVLELLPAALLDPVPVLIHCVIADHHDQTRDDVSLLLWPGIDTVFPDVTLARLLELEAERPVLRRTRTVNMSLPSPAV